FAAIPARRKTLHPQLLVHTHRSKIFDSEPRRDGAQVAKPVHFAHDFVEYRRDDSAVNESGSALVFRPQPESSHDSLAWFIELESKLHSARIAATASEAGIRGISLAHAIGRRSAVT